MPKIDVVKIATLTGHRDCIYTLEKGKESNVFYSAGGDGMIVKWDLKDPENGELVARVNNSVYALYFFSEKNHLLVGENFEGIHRIDLDTKKEIHSAKITEASIFDIKCANGKIFAVTGDGSLIVLKEDDFSTLAKIKVSDKSARCIALNEEKKEAAIGYSDNTIRIFSLDDFHIIKVIHAHGNSIFTLAYSADGNWLISGSRDAHLKIWNAKNDYSLSDSIVAHMYAINHISFSQDRKYFASCSMDKSIKIWDAQTFQLLKVIDKARYAGHGTSVNKLLWTSFENRLISCSDDRTISIWELNFNT
ncbi:MAG: WD40 repeat domain-containing protein [Cytophagaceae bacterium]|nr:WD40 repeat domain-containing protein [Cytophagaceae bacterium]